jgi:hypothetical protein
MSGSACVADRIAERRIARKQIDVLERRRLVRDLVCLERCSRAAIGHRLFSYLSLLERSKSRSDLGRGAALAKQ